MRRYSRSPIIAGGQQYGTTNLTKRIFQACEDGLLEFSSHVLREGERLDVLAGQMYGDGSLWWIIAAASGVGWAPQVPPGTVLRIPRRLDDVEGLLG